MYAIIESCGKQYKVAEGDVVFFEKLDAEEGKKVSFDKVVLVSDDKKVEVGAPYVKDKIRQAIKKINSEQNTTIVLTTHDMLDIESLADKIIMIDKGKLAFQGSIEKLRSMYGEGKIITFKLTDVSDFSKLIQSIETSGIEAKITREDRQVSILFDASKNSISSFIINLLQSVNVNDIMLSDIGIDEIVKKAYSREV